MNPTEQEIAAAKCTKCGHVGMIDSNGLCCAPANGQWEDWRTTGQGRDAPPCKCKCSAQEEIAAQMEKAQEIVFNYFSPGNDSRREVLVEAIAIALAAASLVSQWHE